MEGIYHFLKNNLVFPLSTTHVIMTAEINSYEKVTASSWHFAIVEIIFALFCASGCIEMFKVIFDKY